MTVLSQSRHWLAPLASLRLRGLVLIRWALPQLAMFLMRSSLSPIPDCVCRSTKDSHFVQEGSVARHLSHDAHPAFCFLLCSQPIPYTKRTTPVGTNPRRRSDFDAWHDLAINQMHSPSASRLKDANKQVSTAHPYSIPPTRRR